VLGAAVVAIALIAVATGRGTAQAATTARVSPTREYPPRLMRPIDKVHRTKAVPAAGSTAAGSAAALSPVSVRTIYLQVANISGEVTDPSYTGAIALQDFTWGSNTTVTRTSVLSAGKPTLSELAVQGYEDRSGPYLYKALATGSPIPTVTLTELGVVNNLTVVTGQITLTNAVVTSYQLFDGGGDANIFDANFAYDKQTTTYYQYDSTGTQIGSPISFCWSTVTQSQC
jgi:type VI protein secretion system component Hcp